VSFPHDRLIWLLRSFDCFGFDLGMGKMEKEDEEQAGWALLVSVAVELRSNNAGTFDIGNGNY
jgi:hypothetical protein